MDSINFINQLFDRLDQWKEFPTYQLERRADIFFAMFLPLILKEELDFVTDKILPEFPVRYGDVHPEREELNKSYRIDYVAVDKNQKKVLLIELKTDVNSLRESQHNYLEVARNLNVSGLTAGFNRIMKASGKIQKYKNYFKELVDLEWFEKSKYGHKVTTQEYAIEVLYIVPDAGKLEGKKCISFEKIIKILESTDDFVAKRFAQSLGKW